MTEPAPVRIAMWSGPRNISTAMMRSFGNRPDAVAVDEPFYAAYLAATGIDHPIRAAVLSSQPVDGEEAARRLMAPLPEGVSLQYQKHMTHHMVAGVPDHWFADVVHAFLIRRPEDVLASYRQRREAVTVEDIGFLQQRRIFEAVAGRAGERPVVVDAAAVLADPRGTLTRLCAALAIPFREEMLSWAPGARPEDGVWGEHWYGALWRSSGFSPPKPPVAPGDLTPELRAIAAAARPAYEALAAHAL